MTRRRHRTRFHWRALHGIVLLDKPAGLSSNQALQQVRQLLRAAKGGHAGALDPIATGLLPLCFGEATKLAGSLLGGRKAYRATCRLGVTTTTADSEGNVLRTRPVPALDVATIEAALAPLRGAINQVPPAHSALKQGGERLYLKARRGELVDVPPREVEVFRLELLECVGDTLSFEVECGSGTYVRSLAADLGENLGCGAHLIALRRLWVEPFVTPTMVTLPALEAAAATDDAELLAWLLPTEVGLGACPRLVLDAMQCEVIGSGGSIIVAGRHGLHAALDERGVLRALLDFDAVGCSRIVRGFNLPSG
ncbi:MAG: tRNA pseudouridine(55) synthase TruB [Rhodanobacter sp.]|nr:MAG: tRNA pseudouridine(55) synthase TruB [Rhodanobacter sp.]TAM08660.1 MAG: tRNA pseudouridine(55) synthase TruB [Rhodanobacter sp.]TAM36176.1 MAG: tRNA pseudouridine(55) synthase TruB [Rhodanobacter sp.]